MIAGLVVLHEGYNSGVNLAKAVNFAIPQWLRVISNKVPCTCFRHNLTIDVKQIYLKWQDIDSIEEENPFKAILEKKWKDFFYESKGETLVVVRLGLWKKKDLKRLGLTLK